MPTESPTIRRKGSRLRHSVIILIAVLAGSILAACLFGPMDIPANKVMSILWSRVLEMIGARDLSGDPSWEVVVLDIRLSRIVLSCLVGACMGVAGTVFQGLLRNPLADPFTLGVSSGAAFGATLVIYLGISRTVFGLSLLPLAGLAGSLGALVVVIGLGRINGELRRETLILAGIVVATFLAALISLLKALDEEAVSAMVFWIMGSFQGRGWNHVGLLIPYMVLGLVFVFRYSRELDILCLGDLQAHHLGVDVERVRIMLLLGASLMTGAAVAVSGIIGFVGLVVPHFIRLLQGSEHRPLLIMSGLGGGLLLLWSDVLAKNLLPGGVELPVGVITALLGGPFFCLLLKGKGHGGFS
jgi:iron complex transport system permease protein